MRVLTEHPPISKETTVSCDGANGVFLMGVGTVAHEEVSLWLIQ